VRAYPRETQEMVFDAHDRAFALFKGACGRGIYDNMKTAVERIFVGKDRLYNRRFLQMCSHYLIELVACTPASGWEKGQVENQVGLVRERFFTPRLRFKTYDKVNAWLLDKCIGYAKVLAKDLDDFQFEGTPINQTPVNDLASGGFIAQQRNAVLVGGTGTGKTHPAIAIARSRIRSGARGRFYNVVDLVNRLETETRNGRQGRLADHLTRMDFIVLDELGYLPFAQSGG
jgi:IstB-like ATP binding protein